MNKTPIIPLLAALLASCTDEITSPPTSRTLYQVPIELWTSPATTDDTRTPGDPGIDARLTPPTHIYVFATAQCKDNKYLLEYSHCDVAVADWEHNGRTDNQSCYTLNAPLQLSLPNFQSGRVYAVASERELTLTQVQSVYDHLTENNFNDGFACLEQLAADPTTTLCNDATLDLTGWTSDDLRDLYSTPADDNIIKDGFSNGELKRGDKDKPLFGAIRLYHCAAKLDFTWEVATDLQATTALASITAKNLPTTCCVFKPTENPTGNGTSLVLGDASSGAVNAVTTGNKWLGRACAYVLQPPAPGSISYQVTFDGRNASNMVTGTAPSDTPFTTWYRVVATVESH